MLCYIILYTGYNHIAIYSYKTEDRHCTKICRPYPFMQYYYFIIEFILYFKSLRYNFDTLGTASYE